MPKTTRFQDKSLCPITFSVFIPHQPHGVKDRDDGDADVGDDRFPHKGESERAERKNKT